MRSARSAIPGVIVFFLGLLGPLPAAGQSPAPVHGLWAWKTAGVLEEPHAAEAMRDFCRGEQINEVYVSFSHAGKGADAPGLDARLAALIRELHGANIRVEALLSSTDADEPGAHREKLLGHVREVIQFNGEHPNARFDGIHLDIEPQQRPENKGAGNLNFLPNLVDALREVRRMAAPQGLTVNADIPNKLLKGDLEQRRMLLSSLDRFTLMLYELSSPSDGETGQQHEDKLRGESRRYLEMAYAGLGENGLAKMAVGLRTPDYADQTSHMLHLLDDWFRGDSHYLGWAWHSYNDHGGNVGN
jgi:hypothetical protein